MELSAFADVFTPGNAADARLTLQGSHGDLAQIQAWRWTLQCSYRPTVYFKEDDEKFDNDIIPLVSAFAND